MILASANGKVQVGLGGTGAVRWIWGSILVYGRHSGPLTRGEGRPASREAKKERPRRCGRGAARGASLTSGCRAYMFRGSPLGILATRAGATGAQSRDNFGSSTFEGAVGSERGQSNADRGGHGAEFRVRAKGGPLSPESTNFIRTIPIPSALLSRKRHIHVLPDGNLCILIEVDGNDCLARVVRTDARTRKETLIRIVSNPQCSKNPWPQPYEITVLLEKTDEPHFR